jgi:hypothetical protein
MLILKYRYDYFSSIRQLVFRMPSPIHKKLLAGVVIEITHQLSTITSRQGPSADFARDIEYWASTTIEFNDPDYSRHDPDASFGHLKARYPGIILEVSYTQKRKDLLRLADDYILGSTGNIRVVIGLDIEYLGKTATLSIWRPRFLVDDDGEEELRAEQTVINQVYLFSSPPLTLSILTIIRLSATTMVDQI